MALNYNSDWDVIVVGAGPAGSVAARYAARKGVSVLVLEKDVTTAWQAAPSYPVSKWAAESKRNDSSTSTRRRYEDEKVSHLFCRCCLRMVESSSDRVIS